MSLVWVNTCFPPGKIGKPWRRW